MEPDPVMPYEDVAPPSWDEMSCELLDPVLGRKGKTEDIRFVKEQRLYVKVPESECWRVTGKGPVGTRWVNANKGTS